MKEYVKLIRPQQWIKNVFVFVPMFFGGNLLNAEDLAKSVITFFAFSFVASAIYCFNDIIDVEADRGHAHKRMRPIASGAVSVMQGYAVMAVMLALSILCVALLWYVDLVIFTGLSTRVALSSASLLGNATLVGAILLSYFALNVAYCLWLKAFAIVDVCVVAFGFVLRVLAGGLATDVQLSKWIVLMTFLLTLFMSFAKRRDDVLIMNETGKTPRRNTSEYNLTFINQAITIVASVMLVCYIMYTVSPEVTNHFHTRHLYLTSVFVLVGLLRYVQITVVDENSGDPTKVILHDRFTQAIVLLWGLAFLVIIYVI